MNNRCPSCKHFATEVECRCQNCGTQWRFSFLDLTRAYEQAARFVEDVVRIGTANLSALVKDAKELSGKKEGE